MSLLNMNDFRKVDRNEYPELKEYTDCEIYDRVIGCGGLYLATHMVRHMNLKKGDIVLDLGCGFGTASIFLAKTFGVTVIALDLWFPPSTLVQRIRTESYLNQIIPLNFDITQAIPFAENYFDAIFCMNSLFLYGDNIGFLKKLMVTLKPGGVISIGSECFNVEPTWDKESEVPKEFNFSWNWNVWESCYSKYHSPLWWKERLNGTDLLDLTYCEELADADVLYEDLALNYYQYFSEDIRSMGAMIPQERIVDQIVYGKANEVHPSLYVLSGMRK
jgi:SAM-dependent methyltransferase